MQATFEREIRSNCAFLAAKSLSIGRARGNGWQLMFDDANL